MCTVLEVDRINELLVMKHELDARSSGVEEAVARRFVLRVDCKRLQDGRVVCRCRLICTRIYIYIYNVYESIYSSITESVMIGCTEELSTENNMHISNSNLLQCNSIITSIKYCRIRISQCKYGVYGISISTC